MYNHIHMFLGAIKIKKFIEIIDQSSNLSNTIIIKTFMFYAIYIYIYIYDNNIYIYGYIKTYYNHLDD